MRQLIEEEHENEFRLVGYDMAFVPEHVDADGMVVRDRLYVAADDGNQTYVFNLRQLRSAPTRARMAAGGRVSPDATIRREGIGHRRNRASIRLRRKLDSRRGRNAGRATQDEATLTTPLKAFRWYRP